MDNQALECFGVVQVQLDTYRINILDYNNTFLHLEVTVCIVVGTVLLTVCDYAARLWQDEGQVKSHKEMQMTHRQKLEHI